MEIYKKLSKDIQERIDNILLENKKIVYNDLLNELKQKIFLRTIFYVVMKGDNIVLQLINSNNDIVYIGQNYFYNNLELIKPLEKKEHFLI